jgi:hypothetical protein
MSKYVKWDYQFTNLKFISFKCKTYYKKLKAKLKTNLVRQCFKIIHRPILQKYTTYFLLVLNVCVMSI